MSQPFRSTRLSQSASDRNHRRQLRRQLILQLLDKLDQFHDLYSAGDPRREAVLCRIEHWEYRVPGRRLTLNREAETAQAASEETALGCSYCVWRNKAGQKNGMNILAPLEPSGPRLRSLLLRTSTVAA